MGGGWPSIEVGFFLWAGPSARPAIISFRQESEKSERFPVDISLRRSLRVDFLMLGLPNSLAVSTRDFFAWMQARAVKRAGNLHAYLPGRNMM